MTIKPSTVFVVSYLDKATWVPCGAVYLTKSGRGYKATFGDALANMYPPNTKTGENLVKAAKYLLSEGAISNELDPTKFGITLKVEQVPDRR